MSTLNHLIRWRNRLICYIYIIYIGSELWESRFDGLLSLVKEYRRSGFDCELRVFP